MAPFTEWEMRIAFGFWLRDYPAQQTHAAVQQFNQIQSGITLRDARRALFLSARAAAENMQISQSAYTQLETNERSGVIKLKTLREAAAALDCEVIYGLRPRGHNTFAARVWEAVVGESLTHNFLRTCNPSQRALALAAAARENCWNADFRRRNGWSLRRTSPE